MKIAFTICSNNYLAQAKTLGDTLMRHNPDYLFIIGLCDKKTKKIDYSFFDPYQIIEAENIAIEGFDDMVSRYSVVELNTSVKPFFFHYLFKKYKDAEMILYFDPDIAVFRELKPIEDEFEGSSIFLTPHIYTPIDFDGKTPTENNFTSHGIYNLGFLGLKRSDDSFKFLSWWKDRLFANCYEKTDEGMFVDQLLINFVPIFFNNVCISKNWGLNVAPWNLHERRLTINKGEYFINGKDPLIFYHFSNYNPLTPSVLATNYNRVALTDNTVLKKLYDEYGSNLLKNNFTIYKAIACYYNSQGVHRVPQLFLVRNELDLARVELDSIKTELGLTKKELRLVRKELRDTYSSREWKLVLILQKLVKLLIPKESLRRRIMVRLWQLIKLPLRMARKIRNELLFCKDFLYRFLKLRRPRKVNANSKKIVYIGHSYHDKTKSTSFLIDYLRQFYEVEVVLDESWQGKSFPDLSFVDDSYLGVVFFQVWPKEEILKNIKNDNIIFFPMYDSVELDYYFWRNYQDLKMINFSETLHKKLVAWGFDSISVQYFPEPAPEFIGGNKDEVFFWQRHTKINIHTIAKLLEKENLKIHIHKAVDPEQEFVAPTLAEEKKFGITYSDWFETREEMWDLIKQKGIYIAPRELEGIGLSFLEAMAMGKAVIAADNPTMNEYIKHGKTGYLFNLARLEEIDLSDLDQVQKNTYEFMRKGYARWEEKKRGIIDFIESE